MKILSFSRLGSISDKIFLVRNSCNSSIFIIRHGGWDLEYLDEDEVYRVFY